MWPHQESGTAHTWRHTNIHLSRSGFRSSIKDPSKSNQSWFWSSQLTGAHAHTHLAFTVSFWRSHVDLLQLFIREEELEAESRSRPEECCLAESEAHWGRLTVSLRQLRAASLPQSTPPEQSIIWFDLKVVGAHWRPASTFLPPVTLWQSVNQLSENSLPTPPIMSPPQRALTPPL